MKPSYLIFGAVSAFAILLDQVTKAWIRGSMDVGERRPIVEGFFNLVRAENPGAAWGMFGRSEYRLPFFLVVTSVAFVVILGYVKRLPDNARLLAVTFGLIFSGAAGNFIDRVRFQKVTDFLDFYAGSDPMRSWVQRVLGSNHWPAFNVADICIVVGVGLFAVHAVFLEGRSHARESKDPAASGA